MPLAILTAADKVESTLTVIDEAAVAGLTAAVSRTSSPTLSVQVRRVSWVIPASTGRKCSSTPAATR